MSYSDNDKLDNIIDAAMSQSFEKPDKVEADSLDQLIDKTLEPMFAARPEDDADDLADSREDREYIKTAFSTKEKPASIADIGNQFLDLHSQFQRDPVGAADRLAQFYLRNPYLPKPAAKAAKTHSDGFDRAFEAANDLNAAKQVDIADREATAELRAKLKKEFPGVSFKDFMARIRTMHDDLQTEPLQAAARIAAMYGAPVTDQQHQTVRQQVQHVQQINSMQPYLENAAQRLPQFEALAPEIEAVLRHPDFRFSNDINDNLHRAYQVALANATQSHNAAAVAKAQRAMPTKGGATSPQVNTSSRATLDDMISEALG